MWWGRRRLRLELRHPPPRLRESPQRHRGRKPVRRWRQPIAARLAPWLCSRGQEAPLVRHRGRRDRKLLRPPVCHPRRHDLQTLAPAARETRHRTPGPLVCQPQPRRRLDPRAARLRSRRPRPHGRRKLRCREPVRRRRVPRQQVVVPRPRTLEPPRQAPRLRQQQPWLAPSPRVQLLRPFPRAQRTNLKSPCVTQRTAGPRCMTLPVPGSSTTLAQPTPFKL